MQLQVQVTLNFVIGARRHQFDDYYNLFCLIVICANNSSNLTDDFKELLSCLSHIGNIEKLKRIIYQIIIDYHQRSDNHHSCVRAVLPLRDFFDEQGEIITNKPLYKILTFESEGLKAQFLAQSKDFVEMLLNPNPHSSSHGVGFFEKFQCRLLFNGRELFCINPPPPPCVEQEGLSGNRLAIRMSKVDVIDLLNDKSSLRRPQNRIANCCASLFNRQRSSGKFAQGTSKCWFLKGG